MNIEIENPLELFAELMYINGALLGKELPEMKNLNVVSNKLREYFCDLRYEGTACEE